MVLSSRRYGPIVFQKGRIILFYSQKPKDSILWGMNLTELTEHAEKKSVELLEL
jgi:hypothetical protein